MKKEDSDLLSPAHSPTSLPKASVRRVNNRPLMLAVAMLALFVALIAMVAMKRARASMPTAGTEQTSTSPHQDTERLARDLMGNRLAGVIPAKGIARPASKAMQPPESLPVDLSKPPRPIPAAFSDNERARIEQEKRRQFETAVNAKTAVALQRPMPAPQSQERQQGFPTEALFKAKLALMRGEGSPPLGGEEKTGRWQLHAGMETPETPFELRAGSVIPGVMISGIRSDLPGQIIAQVSQPVYDTATGRWLLIPQGSKLLGVYSSEVSFGKDTLLVAWQRLTFPDGRTLDLGAMPGTDSAGLAGFREKVNNHSASLFGQALLMSGIVAGLTYSQNQNPPQGLGFVPPSAGSVLSAALGQQLGQVSTELIAKNLNIAPTLEISAGYRFNVIAVKDVVFEKPYRDFYY